MLRELLGSKLNEPLYSHLPVFLKCVVRIAKLTEGKLAYTTGETRL
jgi:hypothetical protein